MLDLAGGVCRCLLLFIVDISHPAKKLLQRPNHPQAQKFAPEFAE
jgi:hypothetical protein